MDSSSTIFLSFTSFVYILMLTIVYFSKEKVRTSENNIFTKLVLVTLASLFSELYITIIPKNMDILLFRFSLKLYLVLCVLWLSYFMEYVFIITRNKDNKILINYKKEYKSTYIKFWIMNIFIIGAVILLPISFFNENGMKYSYGPSVNLVFGLCAIYTIVMFIYIIKNITKLRNKGYMPIIFLVILLSVVGIIQKINPSLLLANTCFALITTLMYYTIENPDIKMAKEYAFSKKIAEESRDKTLDTLNELSNDLQSSLSKLQTFGYKKVDKNNIDEVNKNLNYIKNYCIDFVDRVTGLIEIGKVESGSLIIYNSEYETENLLEELRKMFFYEKRNKRINVITEIDNKIPTKLYGDKNKVLQLVLAFYDYLIDIINKDDLMIKIDSISVGRFCKLKFHFLTQNGEIEKHIYKNVSYTLRGSSISDIVFYEKDENIKYEKLKKLASLINAKVEINEKENKEFEILVSINQRIISPYKYLEQEQENVGIKVKYFNASNKRILIASENNANLKKLLLLLSPYKVEIDVVNSIEQLKNELSKNKTFDAILADETLYDNNTENHLINSFKQICGYDIKSIIILSNEALAKKYLDKWFDDYILKPVNKGNINYIMKTYLKDKNTQ